MEFYSQVGQDRFLFENFFYGKRNGVFLDVGAYDGVTLSNTLFFERFLGWSGLCVEPLPSAFSRLRNSRKVACEQTCVSNFEGEADFVESQDVVDQNMLSGLAQHFDLRHVERLKTAAAQTRTFRSPVTTLSSLLPRHGIAHVDYCTIDTEGAELSVLEGIDFDSVSISTLTVEDNYAGSAIPNLMQAKGYDLIARIEQDYVFKHRDVQRLARTTVICPVLQTGLAAADLLRGHAANLARQTAPVEAVYVFHDKDDVPSWLDGEVVVVGQPLTPNMAVNVGLALVRTPLVMTLNAADRLAVDAVAVMEDALLREGGAAIGGCWLAVAGQSEADAIGLAESSQRSRSPRLSASWRAMMWRTDAHISAPRYPWRLRNGVAIEAAGEDVWPRLLSQRLGKKVVHLPMTIGRYCDAAAEVTANSQTDAWIQQVGVSLL